MSIEVKVPVLPESVADATVATWHKKVGDHIKRDENLVDLETDKVVLEVPAPQDGIITEILFEQGDTVQSSQVIARIDKEGISEDNASDAEAEHSKKISNDSNVASKDNLPNSYVDKATSPASRRVLAENDLQAQQIDSSKQQNRITKEDVLTFIEQNRKTAQKNDSQPVHNRTDSREERRVPMSRLRKKVSERLLQTLSTAAMLTTFNEVNLKAVVELRQKYKDSFEKKHQVKLGFMSFFTKAVIEALKRFPAVNASIDGEDIVYHGYYDIGIAVSTERGLVVPVIKDADSKSMADIEKNISEAAGKAREGKLTIEEMQGGTFTITNGGVFGSLLSTPIINPPQTGILGMHKIEERPVVEQGQVVIRPMMYIALSYDHRLIDGRESVQFLVAIKELLEDPSRLLLEV